MATPTVDLQQVGILQEIILRAGDARAPDARAKLQEAYARLDELNYPDATGISMD